MRTAPVCLFGLREERLLCRQDKRGVWAACLFVCFCIFRCAHVCVCVCGFLYMLVCMCAAVIQPSRSDPLVESQENETLWHCYMGSTTYNCLNPISDVAEKLQQKHTGHVLSELLTYQMKQEHLFLPAEKIAYTMWVTVDYVKAI